MREIRPETTPLRVYAVCKLITYDTLTVEDLSKYVEPGSNGINQILNFLKRVEVIIIESDNTVRFLGDQKMLENEVTFGNLMMERIIRHPDSFVLDVVQMMFDESDNIIKINKIQDLADYLANRIGKKVNQEFILGLRFWLTLVGIAEVIKSGNNTTLIPLPTVRIERWLKHHYRNRQIVLIDDFIEALFDGCPELDSCIQNGNFNNALTTSLRILEKSGLIYLEYVRDASSVRMLSQMKMYPSNLVSQVVINI